MSLLSDMTMFGGLVRSEQLLRRGHSHYRIKQALNAGALIRPLRGWLALPSANPDLVFAARHGVLITCVTQAVRLQLWTLTAGTPHFAPRRLDSHVDPAIGVIHWRSPLVLRPPHMLADHLENTLDCVAACLPHEEALAIWDSALQKGLTDYPSLASLPFRGRARALLAECTPYSDSGLESIFRTRLRWLRILIRPQAWIHGHRVDFLLGERLIVQIDGKQHEGAQRTSDCEHDAALMTRGYYVIRIKYAQIVYDWNSVEAALLDVIARKLHLAH